MSETTNQLGASKQRDKISLDPNLTILRYRFGNNFSSPITQFLNAHVPANQISIELYSPYSARKIFYLLYFGKSLKLYLKCICFIYNYWKDCFFLNEVPFCLLTLIQMYIVHLNV